MFISQNSIARLYSFISLLSHSLIERTIKASKNIITRERENAAIDRVMIFTSDFTYFSYVDCDLTLLI